MLVSRAVFDGQGIQCHLGLMPVILVGSVVSISTKPGKISRCNLVL